MAYIGKRPLQGNYKKLADISGSFDGSTTAFTLQSAGVNVSPQSEENCIINISGVQQEPGTAFTIAGSTITFTGAPQSNDTFFGVVLGDTLDIGIPSDSSVSASSLSSSFFVKNNQTLTGISTSGSENALLVGPVTVSGTVTITSGTTLVIA
tara:strand:- start:96 stop:551 length:456 start_codon:yes stop_codon:yes gene_type:complete